VPGIPSEGAALTFLSALGQTPALRWCPPEIALDVPFDPHEAPALLEDFPYPPDPRSGLQVSLFDLE
jgi:hypothetical protein